MMEIPPPKMKRPTVIWATVLELQAMTAPTMMTHAPMNMAHRRPNLSESMAARGAVTMEPLSMIGCPASALDNSLGEKITETYTEYKELIMDTLEPVNSVSKVSMKDCMAVIDPIREPS